MVLKKYRQAFLIIKEEKNKFHEDLADFYEAHYKQFLQIIQYSKLLVFDSETIYFLYLDDGTIKKFLQQNSFHKIDIAILPNEDSPQSMVRYGLSKDIYEAFDDAFNKELRVNDQLLVCNGEVVFKKLSIGNIELFNRQEKSLRNFFLNLKNLKYQSVSFETYKEKSFKTVVSGIMVLEDYTVYNSSFNNIENSSFHDGKLNAFIISPSSILSYIYHFLIIIFYQRFSLKSLIKGIGLISTKKLTLKSPKPFDYILDSVALSSKQIEMEVVQAKLSVSYGKKFFDVINEKNEYDNKESVNIHSLPKGEVSDLLVKGKIPLLKKASDEDMKDTFISVKEGSQVSSIYITLMILSTLLATVGIFQDSTPTVIGAMILAPLMTPIVSLSMGMVRSDNLILKKSAMTLFWGVLSAIFFSAIVTLAIPLDNSMTSQIYTRINPNLLDLFVAIFSGIAGAYAASKEQVAKSLAGVAIAVALVPPLCVSGIGIGWGDMSILYGSLLFFLTNLFGVLMAASITFILLGFAPIYRAKKGVVYSLLVVLIISIPLYFSFVSLIEQNRDYERLENIELLQLDGKEVRFNIISVNNTTADTTLINLEVISYSSLTTQDYQLIKKKLENILNKKIVLEIIPKLIIQ